MQTSSREGIILLLILTFPIRFMKFLSFPVPNTVPERTTRGIQYIFVMKKHVVLDVISIHWYIDVEVTNVYNIKQIWIIGYNYKQPNVFANQCFHLFFIFSYSIAPLNFSKGLLFIMSLNKNSGRHNCFSVHSQLLKQSIVILNHKTQFQLGNYNDLSHEYVKTLGALLSWITSPHPSSLL